MPVTILPLFGGMAIWVTVAGARDIKRLLKDIEAAPETDEPQD